MTAKRKAQEQPGVREVPILRFQALARRARALILES
jgi:hypothetical protein